MADEITMDILNNKINLDRECWCCEGGRKEVSDNYKNSNGDCEWCDGTGYILTSVGEAILKLMLRHGSWTSVR